MLSYCFYFWLLAAPPVVSQAPDDAQIQKILETYAKNWKVPGAGLVVVRPGNGKSVFVTGLRSLGAPEPIDQDTVFLAGSLTKAFTTAVVSQSVAREKCTWETPVHEILPWFPRSLEGLHQPPLKLWHLGSHSTGMGSHDLLFYRQDQPIRVGVEKLLMLPGAFDPGSHYQYQNLMVRALGLAMEPLNAKTWSQQVRSGLLDPLKIHGALFSRDGFLSVSNRARPHRLDKFKEPQNWQDAWVPQNEDPCSSLGMPLKSWVPWIRLHLGLPTGLDAKDSEAILKTHNQRAKQPDRIQDPEYQPEMSEMGYGLGWVTLKYRGVSALAHGGVMDGYRAFILLIPERQLGVVVFANLDRSPLCHGVACELMDKLLGAPFTDWNERLILKKNREEKESQNIRDEVDRLNKIWKSAPWPMEWQGVYQNKAYGEIRFEVDSGAGKLFFRNNEYPVQRIGNDNGFIIDPPLLGEADLRFQKTFNGYQLRVGGRLGASFEKAR